MLTHGKMSGEENERGEARCLDGVRGGTASRMSSRSARCPGDEAYAYHPLRSTICAQLRGRLAGQRSSGSWKEAATWRY